MLKTALLMAITMSLPAAVKIEKINFKGWPNSYRITNGTVELVVTSDIGPRIMRYAFVGGQNLFKEFTDQLGKSGEEKWQLRGGHRIWVAPEDAVKTYASDNGPVQVQVKDGVLTAVQPVEPLTGYQKTITVKLAPTGSHVEVLHRIRNAGRQTADIAPWALTMMAQGGVGIHGFPPRGTHPQVLAPTNPLVMWAFTNLSDRRWRYTKKYLLLHQDPKNADPQKLGSFNPHTWGAYVLNGEMFVKHVEAPGTSYQYPDLGCSFETFTNADFLEIETLGQLKKVAPGRSLEHVENWTLHRNVKVRDWTDAEIDRLVLPLVNQQ